MKVLRVIKAIVCSSLIFTYDSYSRENSFTYNGRTVSYEDFAASNTPPVGYHKVDDLSSCESIEDVFGMSEKSLDILLLSENGENGFVRTGYIGNRATWDIGYFQINDINWERFFHLGITPYDIRWNACINKIVAAYIFKPFYDEARQEYREGISLGKDPLELLSKVAYTFAGYHSQTPKVREKYRKRLVMMIARNLFEGESVGLW